MTITTLAAQLSEWLGVMAVSMLAGTSERFKRRPLAFVYQRRETLFALGLFALILVIAFVFYLILFPAGSTLHRLILAAVSLAPFLLAVRLRGQPARTAGWGMQRLRPAVLLGLALGVLAMFLRGKVFTLMGGTGDPRALDLLFLLGICLAEETIFRGYIQLRLVAVWGAWLGILVTAILFTLWQLPLKLVLGQTSTALLTSLGLAFGQGLVLGYLMHKSGHAAAPGIYRAFSEWLSLLS